MKDNHKLLHIDEIKLIDDQEIPDIYFDFNLNFDNTPLYIRDSIENDELHQALICSIDKVGDKNEYTLIDGYHRYRILKENHEKDPNNKDLCFVPCYIITLDGIATNYEKRLEVKGQDLSIKPTPGLIYRSYIHYKHKIKKQRIEARKLYKETGKEDKYKGKRTDEIIAELFGCSPSTLEDIKKCTEDLKEEILIEAYHKGILKSIVCKFLAKKGKEFQKYFVEQCYDKTERVLRLNGHISKSIIEKDLIKLHDEWKKDKTGDKEDAPNRENRKLLQNEIDKIIESLKAIESISIDGFSDEDTKEIERKITLLRTHSSNIKNTLSTYD